MAPTRIKDNEQDEFVCRMEIAFARMYRLRDVVYGNNWDEHLESAMRQFVKATEDLRISYDLLA